MAEGFTIGGVDLSHRVFVVAEIGNNHEGDPALAAEMVRRAAEAGADAVKFQSIEPDRLVSAQQTERIAQLTRFKLPPEEMARLAELARSLGVAFLSTPFHLGAVDELDPLVPAFKIASGDNEFVPLLRKVAATGKPVLLSGGLATAATLEAAVEIVRAVWRERGGGAFVALLHCVSSYPTPAEEANLGAIPSLAPLADVVGYSDHTLGIEAAAAAVALGARVVEKHFTLDKNQSDFRDHKLSADPAEMAALCARIRVVERMRGDGVKRVMPCEELLLTAAKRSVAAARDLAAGTVLAADDLTWLRPAGGLRPGEEEALLGRPLRRAVQAGETLWREDVGE